MKIDAQQALEDAVKAAARADAVVIVAGLSPEWESEGYDRATLKLPGLQDELISKSFSGREGRGLCALLRPFPSESPSGVTDLCALGWKCLRNTILFSIAA